MRKLTHWEVQYLAQCLSLWYSWNSNPGLGSQHEAVLCTRHFVDWFLQQGPQLKGLVKFQTTQQDLLTHFIHEGTESQRLGHLSLVTKIVSGKARIRSDSVRNQSPYSCVSHAEVSTRFLCRAAQQPWLRAPRSLDGSDSTRPWGGHESSHEAKRAQGAWLWLDASLFMDAEGWITYSFQASLNMTL